MNELVELAKQILRNQKGDGHPVAPRKAGPEEGILTQTSSQMTPLEDFKAKNLAVRIRSAVLGEDVFLVSNEAVRDHLKAEGLVVYLAEEIPCLRGLSPKVLKAVHAAKKVFEKSRVIKEEGRP